MRVTYSRNQTPGQWKAHGRYLQRESATCRTKGRSAGFDAKEDQVNVGRRLDTWQKAGDERLFKLIISPEFGDRLNLVALTRDLLGHMERDLATKLEWAAVIHHNTDHPHVHVVLRGRDDHGLSLRLPREYVRAGIRSHAEGLATRQLGYRTEHDAFEAQRREISQSRFTSLDRIIQRQNSAQDGQFVFRCAARRPGSASASETREQHVAARLAKLELMGLARNIDQNVWAIRGDFEHILRTIQTSNDRQRVLAKHGALLSDDRLPLEFVSLRQLTTLEGRIVAHGQDEGADRPYLMLEGIDGKIHVLYQTEEIQSARHQGQAKINSFVRMQKQFSAGRPSIQISDLGNAYELLHNEAFLRASALTFAQSGIRSLEPTWDGWLGQYQRAVGGYLALLTRQNRNHNHDR